MQIASNCKATLVLRPPAQMEKAMKLTAFFLFVLLLNVSARGFSQKITMNVRNVTPDKVFKEIRRQTGLLFLYDNVEIKKIGKISVVVSNANVSEVLEKVLGNTGLTHRIIDQTIIIEPQQPAALIRTSAPELALADITGFIVNESGNPLSGASVKVKGTSFGTTSDAKGYFKLRQPEGLTVLVISFIGYETQEISFKGGGPLRVVMKAAVNSLDALVVIGYGTTSRRINTGSVSSITSADIDRQPVTNLLTALQGRIPGMQITQDNGLPGSSVRVNIRGAGTGVSTAGFIPLYVIDGVPFTLFNGGQPASDDLNAYGITGANGSLSPFAMINPEEIERIDILKDADATAIYGSRGANGVVLITTKKGTKRGTSVSVKINQGTGKVPHFIEMMNTEQYLAMRKEAFTNAGMPVTGLDLTTWDQNAYTDWQRYAIGGTARTTNATASVSAGDLQNTFLLSATYRREGTVYPGNYDNKTFSGRVNAGRTSADRRFNVNVSANYAYMRNNLPTVDLTTIFNLAPNYPLYNANGTVNWTSTSPLSYFKKDYTGTTTNLITNIDLSYKILPDLLLKANMGYTTTRLKQTATNPASSQNPSGTTISKLTYADNNNDNYIIEPQLSYNKTIGPGKLNVLAGATFQQNKSTGIYLAGSGYTNESLINSLTAASSITVTANNYSIYKYNAFFGRLTYNWNEKYIIDATARRDGSSRFGPGKRFGNFGSVGGAWIFTKERFANNWHFLSFGKLRGSYGITGNDQIPDYLYDTRYSVSSTAYAYQGTTTYYLSGIANAGLQWEVNKKLDVALELGFFGDRILLKGDFYRNRSSNQLRFVTLGSQVGTNGYYANFPAVVQNKGWEFELNTVNIDGKDFKWTSFINLTFNRNKLVSYPDLATSGYASSYVIGQPTNIRFMYHFTGVDPTTGAPTFEDQDKDGSITYANDRKQAPYGHPYYGGIVNSISYKGFQLDVTLQYNHRNGYIDNAISSNPLGYSYQNQPVTALKRWQKAGDVAKLPAATKAFPASYSNFNNSDFNWGDASYWKLKNVSISYSLPKAWIRSVKMTNASMYVQGQNLYTWAKQKNTFDPETTVSGAPGLGTGQYIAMPQLRTIVVGINCNF